MSVTEEEWEESERVLDDLGPFLDESRRRRMERPRWDAYFLAIAQTVALRADCSRRQVGAVVVDEDHRIVSTGYNGAAPGRPGCLEGRCPRAKSDVPHGSSYDTGPGTCIAVHAEANAIIYAGRNGCDGATLYLTTEPCDGCLKLIEAAGIVRIVWPDELQRTRVKRFARRRRHL